MSEKDTSKEELEKKLGTRFPKMEEGQLLPTIDETPDVPALKDSSTKEYREVDEISEVARFLNQPVVLELIDHLGKMLENISSTKKMETTIQQKKVDRDVKSDKYDYEIEKARMESRDKREFEERKLLFKSDLINKGFSILMIAGISGLLYLFHSLEIITKEVVLAVFIAVLAIATNNSDTLRQVLKTRIKGGSEIKQINDGKSKED